MNPSELDGYGDAVRACLREARERRGWSQAELGRRVDRTQAWVCNLETGRAVMTRANFVRLALALEKPIGWFLGLPEALAS